MVLTAVDLLSTFADAVAIDVRWATLLCVIVLIQYCLSCRRLSRAKTLKLRADESLLNVDGELVVARHDRTMSRLENQILREFVAQGSVEKAISLLLRRYVPNTREGLAAIVPIGVGREAVSYDRGLSEESRRTFSLPAALIERIQAERFVALDEQAIHKSGLKKLLSQDDRRKVGQLFLVGGGREEEAVVLVTTKLYPVGGSPVQQAELSQRLMSSVSESLKQRRVFDQRSDELRTLHERFALRSIADKEFETPIEMIREVLEQLRELLNAQRISLPMARAEGEIERVLLCRSGESLSPGSCVRWQMHEARIVDAAAAHGVLQTFDRKQLASIGVDTLVGGALVAPLRQDDKIIAFICCTREQTEGFTTPAIELTDWCAGFLAEAIERLLNLATVERQARMDSLTNVANRREFDKQIAQEFVKAVRNRSICSLILFDIDHFKLVNDTYGHQAGDHVLKVCVHLMQRQLEQIRETDNALLARYGGEELALLLPGVDETGAARIAESIRFAIDAERISHNGNEIATTVSAGIASFPGCCMTVTQLIAATDAALYAAKEFGRNCVMRATQPTVRMSESRR